MSVMTIEYSVSDIILQFVPCIAYRSIIIVGDCTTWINTRHHFGGVINTNLFTSFLLICA